MRLGNNCSASFSDGNGNGSNGSNRMNGVPPKRVPAEVAELSEAAGVLLLARHRAGLTISVGVQLWGWGHPGVSM